MVIRGRIENGVVVLAPDVSLPEGTEVTVLVAGDRATAIGTQPEHERSRVLQIMDRIAALPIEGSGEPFSAADHDKVLYGKP